MKNILVNTKKQKHSSKAKQKLNSTFTHGRDKSIVWMTYAAKCCREIKKISKLNNSWKQSLIPYAQCSTKAAKCKEDTNLNLFDMMFIGKGHDLSS